MYWAHIRAPAAGQGLGLAHGRPMSKISHVRSAQPMSGIDPVGYKRGARLGLN
jgi:hypothetical protein